MNEIWLPIQGFEGLYEISNFGQVKSLPFLKRSRQDIVYMTKERIRKPGFSRYFTIDLYRRDGTFLMVSVHRLVATHFVENPSNLPYINHKDNNPKNNHSNNLEWVSNRENVCHRLIAGQIKYRAKKYSRFIGVTWHRNRWEVYINVGKRHVYLGRFVSEQDAGKAYTEALKTFNIQNKYTYELPA